MTQEENKTYVWVLTYLYKASEDSYTDVTIYANEEEAKKRLKWQVDEFKKCTEDYKVYVIEEDSPYCFDAWRTTQGDRIQMYLHKEEVRG